VLALSGVGVRSEVPGSEGAVEQRLDLRYALRRLVRDRAAVEVVLVDGTVVAGTFDRVAADHVDLAQHAPDEARRARAVRQVLLLPLSALALVRVEPR
jgi:transcription termination factor Rho